MRDAMTTLTISPIPAFSDNYIWLLHSSQEAFVIDPGEPEPVLNAFTTSMPHQRHFGHPSPL